MIDPFRYIDINHPFRKLVLTLLALLLLGLCLETWRYSVRPSPIENRELIQSSLTEASGTFQQQQGKFLELSRELTNTIRKQLEQRHHRRSLYRTLQNYSSFWGSTLIRNDTVHVWNGYAGQALSPPDEKHTESRNLRLKKHNNVVYWEYYANFSIPEGPYDSIPYEIYTTAKIEQTVALPIGRDSEYHLVDEYSDELHYPVTFTFFNPLPENILQHKPLVNTNRDSVGAVYVHADQLKQAKAQWLEQTQFWRSLFLVFSFLCLSFLLYLWFEKLPELQSLAYQLGIIVLGWITIDFLDVSLQWVQAFYPITADPETIHTAQLISTYAIDALFLFFIAFSLNRKVHSIPLRIEHYWYPTTITIAAVLGTINAGTILYAIHISYQVALNSNIILMDLQVLPSAGTIFFYLFMGLMFFSVALLLVALNRFLLRSGKGHHKIVATIIGAGFALALLIAQSVVPASLRLNWSVTFSLLAFAIIFGAAMLYTYRFSWIEQLSTLRSMVIVTFLIAVIGTAITYNSYLANQEQTLKNRALSFSEENDPYARKLLSETLTRLEDQFRGVSRNDVRQRAPYMQSEFTNTLLDIISGNLRDYSVDLQLVDEEGELITNYSTSLKSPDWVEAFNISRLSVVTTIEQITRNNNRPIIQQPELINKEDYSTFYRGWIPLFSDSSPDPIGWILGSVYRERPDFNKPIRAVMAALNYEDWSNSYLLQEYRNNQLTSSYKQGITGYFPRYNELQQPAIMALGTDSLFYYNTEEMGYTYRNLLWNMGVDRVIKASTIMPGYRNILFAFFRFNFILLIASCLIAFTLHATGLQTFKLYGKHERFRNRILDNFLLATLVFLMLLVVTTHYAISQQNKDIVRQDLFSKLERLTESAQTSMKVNQSEYRLSLSLDSLASPLDVDATFYRDKKVSTSTTPQIYQQYLLPDIMPFPTYDDLFINQQRDALTRVGLGSQQLLIGYRSVLSPSNEPVAAVAIPTFLQSPKYDQQLLETTSYLIIFYLLVFGLFIIGTTLISRRLTRPIRDIQRGLNKISKGNLDTTIKVTSNDELGNLAEAYNEMVRRLKELQEELAIAEREAAWKEMAQQVAHEIKNPLTPMKLNVQHLERQLSSNDMETGELKNKIKKITKNLIDQIQSLNNIASDFSKFSQPLEEDFEEVVLNDLIESVKNLYEHDEKVQIEVDQPSHHICIDGVRDELRRVIINLTKNAFEAMPEGGTITVSCYAKEDSAFIEVEDEGVGIPEDDKSKIFVPNFSTKSSGTGLGLAICKKVIEAHGGSISFASIKDRGTTFVIKLPLHLKKPGSK